MQQITAIRTNDGKIFFDKNSAVNHLEKRLVKILYDIAGQVHAQRITDIAEILRGKMPELMKANDILTDLNTYES